NSTLAKSSTYDLVFTARSASAVQLGQENKIEQPKQQHGVRHIMFEQPDHALRPFFSRHQAILTRSIALQYAVRKSDSGRTLP
ncbi:hypothetical protein, partial [Sphingobium sp. MK2]|uniref:hypothetical protein n=1 Tax=Sphingobium sp. MK2 TaxID=3116540 RepID=UPI0032E35F4C